MIMIDRERQLAKPLHIGRGGLIALGLAVALLLAGTVWLFARGSDSHPGCVEVVFASTLGAARIEKCGRQAQELCAHPQRIPSLAGQVSAACRRAGFSS